jgi:hypothetical protein
MRNESHDESHFGKGLFGGGGVDRGVRPVHPALRINGTWLQPS